MMAFAFTCSSNTWKYDFPSRALLVLEKTLGNLFKWPALIDCLLNVALGSGVIGQRYTVSSYVGGRKGSNLGSSFHSKTSRAGVTATERIVTYAYACHQHLLPPIYQPQAQQAAAFTEFRWRRSCTRRYPMAGYEG